MGYPQSSPELRQELISEQFVRGQSDPEVKKYLWVVIRTHTLDPASNIHRPAEQVFAMEEDDELEDMMAMMDRSQWTGPGVSEPTMPPSLQQMFTFA